MADHINKQPHWRCRLCGCSSPTGAAVCENPRCGADLAIYGEMVVPGPEEPRPAPPPPEPAEPRLSAEEERAAAEAARRYAEQQRIERERAARPRKKSGMPKGLIAGLVCLVLVLGLGGGLVAVHFLTDFELPFVLPWDKSDSSDPDRRDQDQDRTDKSDGSDKPGRPDKEDDPAPVDPNGWRNNVMTADPFIYTEGAENHYYPVFGSDVARTEITSITFMNNLNDPVFSRDCWDISAAGDQSVLCRVSGSPGNYDMYIGGSGGVLAPADCAYLFAYYDNLRTVDFGGFFHTDNTRDMRGMFSDCQSLATLDLGGLNTSNVTDMKGMFGHCEGLTDINVGSFDTSSVTNMMNMFSYCTSLTSLDVTGFNTSNVTDMFGMFSHCEGLTELDVTGFDTARVTDMCMMFCDCTGLKELDISSFKTSNVTNMSFMFDDVDDDFVLHYSPENFDTTNVVDHMYFLPDTFDWEKMFR